MTKLSHPFALPGKLPSDLDRVRGYWDKLKRGENAIPFWDDVKLSSVPGAEDRLMLIDVFENPQRFRLNTIDRKIHDWYGADIAGKFADEIEAKGPFAYFIAQASATVEAAAPTFFHGGYSRLLLPMWGRGRIEMILGAVTHS